MLKDKIQLGRTRHGLWLSALAASALLGGGCRSTSGLNLFARSSEPSAEVLAGSGPSTTYPAPPSASATPQAIASIAGGTGGTGGQGGTGVFATASATPATPTATRAAGFVVPSGRGTPATGTGPKTRGGPTYAASPSSFAAPNRDQPSVNYAAANANGVYGNSGGSGTRSSRPSPYTFGTKTFTPNTTPETSPVVPPSGQSNPPSTAYALSGGGSPAAKTQVPSVSPAQPTGPAGPIGGFALPPDLATASITPPTSNPTASRNQPSVYALGGPPAKASEADSGPAFSTASATLADPPASPAGQASPAGSASRNASGGYTPGSTAGSSGYPAGSDRAPATSGSFYR